MKWFSILAIAMLALATLSFADDASASIANSLVDTTGGTNFMALVMSTLGVAIPTTSVAPSTTGSGLYRPPGNNSSITCTISPSSATLYTNQTKNFTVSCWNPHGITNCPQGMMWSTTIGQIIYQDNYHSLLLATSPGSGYITASNPTGMTQLQCRAPVTVLNTHGIGSTNTTSQNNPVGSGKACWCGTKQVDCTNDNYNSCMASQKSCIVQYLWTAGQGPGASATVGAAPSSGLVGGLGGATASTAASSGSVPSASKAFGIAVDEENRPIPHNSSNNTSNTQDYVGAIIKTVNTQ